MEQTRNLYNEIEALMKDTDAMLLSEQQRYEVQLRRTDEMHKVSVRYTKSMMIRGVELK